MTAPSSAPRPAAARAAAAPGRLAAGGLRWLLLRLWCLLLGARLGRGLRSALGGSPVPDTGPPVRPRRPGSQRRARGGAAQPYPSAA